MLKKISVKDLYPLALAEGEGVGTAYEYYAKRLMLALWLSNANPPDRMLIAGLPQKYGASLDFVLLAAELNAELVIVDDRPDALVHCESAVRTMINQGHFPDIKPEYLLTRHIPTLPELSAEFDLALSSETLQRIPQEDQPLFIRSVLNSAARFAIFTPNGDNPAHTSLSGLSGLRLDELVRLAGHALDGGADSQTEKIPEFGYLDMPPFPPGITRTEDQRAQASTGTLEAIAMWGLTWYAHLEHWLPGGLRHDKSHIVYAFLDNFPR
ncbi:MAG: hypothetical protein R3293_16145 [Candidatus Promineifilaceae bacterium]|nr:hypothetical protein [Candidatus Promineifilaceae bacterium]